MYIYREREMYVYISQVSVQELRWGAMCPICVYIYVYIYIYMCMYIYIYIERERDRCMHIYPEVLKSGSALILRAGSYC